MITSQNLKSENYKGVKVKFAQKIASNKKVIIGKWLLKRKPFELVSQTKSDAYNRIKRIIDRNI